MASATRGVPVTHTGSLKSTVASSASSAMKTPFGPCASPETATPVTVGTPVSAALPFTMKPAASARAWSPRPSEAAFIAASTIVPPFSASAVAPTATPSASVSVQTTV